MISIPINKINELGYITESEIAPLSARVLSEYDTYEIEFKRNKSKIKK